MTTVCSARFQWRSYILEKSCPFCPHQSEKTCKQHGPWGSSARVYSISLSLSSREEVFHSFLLCFGWSRFRGLGDGQNIHLTPIVLETYPPHYIEVFQVMPGQMGEPWWCQALSVRMQMLAMLRGLTSVRLQSHFNTWRTLLLKTMRWGWSWGPPAVLCKGCGFTCLQKDINHRITACLRLEGTSGDLLIQPPAQEESRCY